MSLEMKYFVLRPRSKAANDTYAIASRAAMNEYARVIKTTNPDLSEELKLWVLDETTLAMAFHDDPPEMLKGKG